MKKIQLTVLFLLFVGIINICMAQEEVVSVSGSSKTPDKVMLSRYESLKQLTNVSTDKRYDMSSSINENYYWFFDRLDDNQNRHYGIANKEGQVILPSLFTRGYGTGNKIKLSLNGYYGIFNFTSLNWDIPMIYSSLEESNGIYIAKKMNYFGVIDGDNQTILDFKWNSVNTISNLGNYVIVGNNSSPVLYGIYSLIEKTFIIPCKYSSIQTVDGQLTFKVKYYDQSNIIDLSDSTLFKTWYDELINISNSNNYVVKKNNLFGIINSYGNVLVPIEYLEISTSPYSDGSFLAKNKNSKYGFMTVKGEVTLPFVYDRISDRYNDNYTSLKNGKCGLVRVNSGVPQEIQTCEFDEISNKRNSIITKKGDKYGILDKFGKEIVAPKYDNIDLLNADYYQNNQLFIVKENNHYLIMSDMGRIVDETPYVEIAKISNRKNDYYSSSFNYIKVKEEGGQYKIIDKTGRMITRSKFDEILNEDGNIFLVREKDKMGLFYLMNNKYIVDCKYDQIIFDGNIFIGINGTKFDYFEINGGKAEKL
jgi:hypothetical protein